MSKRKRKATTAHCKRPEERNPRRAIMKQALFTLSTKVGQLDAQQVRIILAVGSLVLFVLGAGAPAGRGDL
jgi:hypothetical protein